MKMRNICGIHQISSAIFQLIGSRTNFYVNGNPIDFTYERTVKSNGNIYFNLYKTKDQNVVLFQQKLCR